jgi:hypothetical protein
MLVSNFFTWYLTKLIITLKTMQFQQCNLTNRISTRTDERTNAFFFELYMTKKFARLWSNFYLFWNSKRWNFKAKSDKDDNSRTGQLKSFLQKKDLWIFIATSWLRWRRKDWTNKKTSMSDYNSAVFHTRKSILFVS